MAAKAARPSSAITDLRAAPSAPHWATIQARSSISRSVATSRYCARRSQLPSVQFLHVVVGGRASAGARAGAVEILAPQQELDGVIAGGDVRFHAARFLQLVASSSLVIFEASTGSPPILIDGLAMTLAM